MPTSAPPPRPTASSPRPLRIATVVASTALLLAPIASPALGSPVATASASVARRSDPPERAAVRSARERIFRQGRYPTSLPDPEASGRDGGLKTRSDGSGRSGPSDPDRGAEPTPRLGEGAPPWLAIALLAALFVGLVACVAVITLSTAPGGGKPRRGEPASRRGRRDAEDASPDGDAEPPRERAPAPLGDADRLAEEGRFGEAIHALLLRSLRAVEAAAGGFAASLTAREILAGLGDGSAGDPSLAGALPPLDRLTRLAEPCVFGARVAGEDDLARARTLFARILSALPAGASVSASDPRDDEGDRDPAVDDERDGVR